MTSRNPFHVRKKFKNCVTSAGHQRNTAAAVLTHPLLSTSVTKPNSATAARLGCCVDYECSLQTSAPGHAGGLMGQQEHLPGGESPRCHRNTPGSNSVPGAVLASIRRYKVPDESVSTQVLV